MRRVLPLLIALAACSGSPAPEAPRTPPAPTPLACTRFENVRLFDGAKVTASASVVVDGALVKEVNGPTTCTTTIDGKGKTLLPGLIDAHTHTWNEDHLEQALRFGVTTELDMMGNPNASAQLKAAAAKRTDIADLRYAGFAVTSRGGHGTEYGFTVPTLDRVEDAEDFVAQRAAEHADYLKIVYTPYSKIFKSITPDMLKAVAASAKRHHLLSVVHIDTFREANDAIDAGVDGLAHLFWDVPAGADFAHKVKDHGAFVVPTLSILHVIQGKSEGPALLADARLRPLLDDDAAKSLGASFKFKVEAPPDPLPETIASLRAAGVPILAGTDAPNPGTAHGVSLHGELAALVKAGLTPTEALVAATSAPADAFHLPDRGRIAPGLRADLVLVDGDPTTDITATRSLAGVWRGGVKFDKPLVKKKPHPAETPPPPPPTQPPALISDFNGKDITSKYGLGWKETTDALVGGKSTATIALKDGALAVSGVVDPMAAMAWAGAIFNASEQMWGPVDVSAAKELVFKARGDGNASYTVMLFTKKRGPMPSRRPFVAPKRWKEQHIKLSDFDGTDGSDVIAIAWVAGPNPGKFAFELDDVELR